MAATSAVMDGRDGRPYRANARSNDWRARSHSLPSSENPTRAPASDSTFGTTASNATRTYVSSPFWRAIVSSMWSCRPRRRFANWIVPMAPR
jgi:hypothetical protein